MAFTVAQISNPVSIAAGQSLTGNQGTAAALAGAWPVKITDGVNTMPTGDAAARSIHTTIDNASIAVTGTLTANIGTTNGLALDATLTGGTLRSKITDGTTNVNVKAASTLPVATDTALVVTLRDAPSVSVSNFPGTQAVSGTVTANIGTTNGLALDATLTGGTQKSIVRSATKGTTTAADVTSTNVDANTQALDVSIKGTPSVSISNFPATQTVAGTVTANAGTGNFNVIGTKSNNAAAPGATNVGALVAIANAAAPGWTEGNLVGLSTDLSGNLRVAGTFTSAGAGDTVGGTTALNALSVAATVALAGQGSVGMQLDAGTLIGTLTPELSFDGGTTWVATKFVDLTNTQTSTLVFGSANTATALTLLTLGGASHARVRVSAFTSGTANGRLRATFQAGPIFTGAGGGANASVGVDGSAIPTSATLLGASDGTNLQQLLVESAANRNLRVSIYNGANELAVNATGQIAISNFPATQTVAGTVTTNIGTTNGLALDATLAKLNVAQATALGTNTGPMIQGSVTTAAPTYITGNINPLSLTTAGALRVDGSGVTQPISGTITANVGTTNGLALDATLTGGTQRSKITDGTTNAAVKAASTAAVAADPALVVAVSPNNTVSISGTVTANIGTTNGLALDATLTGGTQRSKITDGTNNAAVKAASTAAVAADPALVVTVSPNNTVSISGTVTANVGTTNGLALDATLAKLTIAQGATLGTNTQALMGASVTSGAPTYTTGQISPLSIDTAGNLRVTGSFTSAGASDTVGSTVALNALSVTASVALAGQGSVAVQIAAGTLAGTLTPEVSYDGGTTWVATKFVDIANTQTATLVLTNPNAATALAILTVGGVSHARVRVSSFTSGTANATLRATFQAGPNFASVGLDGSAIPTSSTLIGASDGTNLQQLLVESAASRNLRVGIYKGANQLSVDSVGAIFAKVTDGTWTGTVKGPSTLPVATDTALVVTTRDTVSIAQNPDLSSGTIALVTDVVTLNLTGASSSFTVDIRGTWTGQILFSRSTDGTNFDPVWVINPNGNVYTTTASSNGQFVGNSAGANVIQVSSNSWTSGTATITIRASNGHGASFVLNGIRLHDASTTAYATIKTASSTPAATDTQVVVGIHPNSTVKNIQQATTNGGALIARKLSAATTNATSVKASAGQVYGWFIFNANAATRYVKIYDKATAPTVGTDTPALTIPIPAGSGANVWFGAGVDFNNGIAYAMTTGVADSDATAVAANDLILNLFYF